MIYLSRKEAIDLKLLDMDNNVKIIKTYKKINKNTLQIDFFDDIPPEDRICANCGSIIYDYPLLSRFDNSKICSNCDIQENIQLFATYVATHFQED